MGPERGVAELRARAPGTGGSNTLGLFQRFRKSNSETQQVYKDEDSLLRSHSLGSASAAEEELRHVPARKRQSFGPHVKQKLQSARHNVREAFQFGPFRSAAHREQDELRQDREELEELYPLFKTQRLLMEKGAIGLPDEVPGRWTRVEDAVMKAQKLFDMRKDKDGFGLYRIKSLNDFEPVEGIDYIKQLTVINGLHERGFFLWLPHNIRA